MNRQEALKILELGESAEIKDVKKKFKKLAYAKHPDRNKAAGAEDEYKQISAAYEYLKNPPPEPQIGGYYQANSNVISFWDMFVGNSGSGTSPFHQPQRQKAVKIPPHINVKFTISFVESVLGCKKTISINRGIKCDGCDGDASVVIDGTCDTCGGSGMITDSSSGNMVIRTSCNACGGTGNKYKDCESCKGQGSTNKNSKINVSVPPGVVDGMSIRLGNSGNYFKNINIGRHTDVLIRITVTPEPGMQLSGRDVLSSLEISFSCHQDIQRR